MTSPENPLPDVLSSAPRGGRLRSRRVVASAIVLVAGGAVAGGIVSSTLGASAATSPTTSPSAPAPESPAPGASHGPFATTRANLLSGTVTAVAADSVTIKTSTATTTYSVDAKSRIAINELGAGALSGVKVGDTVRFTTTTATSNVIADLRDGNAGFRGGPGGPGGFAGRGPDGAAGPFAGVMPQTGTVTAVGSDTVTIKTSTATTTFSTTSTTRIDKDGTATLADVKVGDTVFFNTTTDGGTVLAALHDGKLPAMGPGGRDGFGPGGPGAPDGSAGPVPNPSTAPTGTGTSA
ncbi:MAG TPA: hypothetical protein VIL94_03065 [Acidothermaceae bacterium]